MTSGDVALRRFGSALPVLVVSQWRLVRRSFWLWTVVGVAVTVLVESGGKVHAFGTPENMPFFAGVLAAALGPRLFVRPALPGEDLYSANLPLAPRFLASVKYAFGAGILLVQVLIYTLGWHSGLLPLICARLWGQEAAVPSFLAWKVTLIFMLATYAASCYFSCSFERAAPARQAGVPAFIVGFGATMLVMEASNRSPGAGAFALVFAGLAASLIAVLSLFPYRRAAPAEGWHERLLRTPPLASRLLTLPAQVAFVAFPLGAMLFGWAKNIAPWVGTGESALVALGCLAIGLALSGWSLRQVRAHELRGWRAAGACAGVLTGVGIPIWRVLRRKGGTWRCARCGAAALAENRRCPRCHGEERAEYAPIFDDLKTPWVIAVLIWASAMFPGGIRSLHLYEIRTSVPDARIFLNEQDLGTGIGRKWKVGWPLGVPLGMMNFMWGGHVDIRAIGHTKHLRAGAIIEGLGEGDRRRVKRFLDPDDTIRFVYRGIEAEVEDILALVALENFRAVLHLDVEVSFPEIRILAEEIAEEAEASDSTLDANRAEELAAWGDLLIHHLRHATETRKRRFGIPSLDGDGRADTEAVLETTVRPASAPVWKALDTILETRFALDRQGPERAARIWRELSKKTERLGVVLEPVQPQDYNEVSLRERYPHLFPYLRALALLDDSATPFIEEKLEGGSPYAAIAAAERGEAHLAPECLEMFREHEIVVAWPPEGEFSLPKIAAAWALLVLDRDRAVDEIFRSLERIPDVFLARLLMYSGSAEVEEHVKHITEAPGSWLRFLAEHDRRTMVHAFERAIGGIRAGLEPEDYWIWE